MTIAYITPELFANVEAALAAAMQRLDALELESHNRTIHDALKHGYEIGGTIGGNTTPQPPAPVDAGPAGKFALTKEQCERGADLERGFVVAAGAVALAHQATTPAVSAGSCPHPASFMRDGVEVCDQCHAELTKATPPADDAAADALCALAVTVGKDNYAVGVLNMFFPLEAARAILAAIRRGEMPGIGERAAYEDMFAALRAELAAAKQDVERLTLDLDEWKSWRKEWIKERDEARARVAELEREARELGGKVNHWHLEARQAITERDEARAELAAMKASNEARADTDAALVGEGNP